MYPGLADQYSIKPLCLAAVPIRATFCKSTYVAI